VNVLAAGPSGSGKSSFATALLERIAAAGYQFCLIDPEGDYQELADAVVLGDARHEPGPTEAAEALRHPERSMIVNLLGVLLDERPAFFAGLAPRLVERWTTTGRPHWLVVDEAHHLLPAEWRPGELLAGQPLKGLVLITVHPETLAPGALASVDVVVATGDGAPDTLRAVAEARGVDPPELPEGAEPPLLWRLTEPGVEPFEILPSTFERRRHTRKYAEGELGEDKSFYFRGPRDDQQLRAQNLRVFLELGDGVNDETWLHHLGRGDYSSWLRESIKDPELADEVAGIEAEVEPAADDTRRRVRDAIEARYTAPARG
jgi:uncharacterized protein DUF87